MMPHTRGGKSSAHVERPYLDDDHGEHYYKHGEHAYDIHVDHEYDHVEHESQYMPIRPIDTSVMRFQDRH
jgi:hypothetical protein